MSRFVVAYNTTDQPLVVDGAGRVLGGRSWGAVASTAAEVKAAAAAGALVLRPSDAAEAADADPAVAEAVARAAELDERRAAFEALDKDALSALAAEGTALDDDAKKGELVHELTLLGVPVPAPETRGTTKRRNDADTKEA